jgi:hypothetical protein
MAKTILIQCKCGCIINQADVKCDLCKIKFKVADKKRKAKSYKDSKKVSPVNEDYERLAVMYEGN